MEGKDYIILGVAALAVILALLGLSEAPVSKTVAYGGIFSHNDSGYVISLSGVGKYYNITQMQFMYGNKTALYSNFGLSIQEIGIYECNYGVSFSSQVSNAEYDFAVLLNGVSRNMTHSHRTIGTTGQYGNTGGVGLINVSMAGSIVSIGVADEANPVTNPTIKEANLVCVKVN